MINLISPETDEILSSVDSDCKRSIGSHKVLDTILDALLRTTMVENHITKHRWKFAGEK